MFNFKFTLFILPFLAAATLAMRLAIVGWRRRHSPGALPFAMLMLAVSWEYMTVALEFSSTTLEGSLFWVHMKYLESPFVGVLIFLTVLGYTRLQSLKRRYLALLLIIPVLTVGVAWTKLSTELLWRNPTLTTATPIPSLTFSRGGWYWVHMSYFLIMVFVSIGLLIYRYRTTNQQIYRQQIRMMGWAGGLILMIAILFLWLGPTFGLYLGPLGFLPGGGMLAWGLYYYRTWDIQQLADRSLIKNMQDALITLDPQGRIVGLNPTAQNLFAPDSTGQFAHNILPDGWLANYVPQQELLTEVAWDHNSDTDYYEIRFLPLYGRSTKFEGTLLMVRQITRRKEAELVREATIAELEAFAHTVAHDLKNPLNIIVGYSSLLQEDAQTLPENVQRRVAAIYNTGEKMTSIINELILLAGLNRQDPEFGAVDMNSVLQHLRIRMALLITQESAQISTQDEWPELVSYAPWIEEVLSNYVSNAIKYGGKPPLVQIGAETLADGRVRLWVKDNGPGLKPEEQTHLFTPFTRLNQLDTRGDGLGLSIVQRIAAHLGGEPAVESIIGQGSTFSLILPGPITVHDTLPTTAERA